MINITHKARLSSPYEVCDFKHNLNCFADVSIHPCWVLILLQLNPGIELKRALQVIKLIVFSFVGMRFGPSLYTGALVKPLYIEVITRMDYLRLNSTASLEYNSYRS